MSNLIFNNASKIDVISECLKLQPGTNYADTVMRGTTYMGQTPKTVKVVNTCSTAFLLSATTLFTDVVSGGNFVATTVATNILGNTTVDVPVSYTGSLLNPVASKAYPITLNGSSATYTLTIQTPDSPPTTQDNTVNLANRTNSVITKSNLIYNDINGIETVTGVRFTGDVSRLFTDTGMTVPYVAGTELTLSTFALYYKAPLQDAASTYSVGYNVKADGIWSL